MTSWRHGTSNQRLDVPNGGARGLVTRVGLDQLKVEGDIGKTSVNFGAYRSICFVRGFFIAARRGAGRGCIPRSCTLNPKLDVMIMTVPCGGK